eukprot:c13090_g1_i1 orf=391-1812(+)
MPQFGSIQSVGNESDSAEVLIVKTSLVVPYSRTVRHNLFLTAIDIDHRGLPYFHLLYFYRIEAGCISHAIQKIQTSLSVVLVHFYPLAGRLVVAEDARHYIDCCDAGVLFVEASTNTSFYDLEKENFQMTPFSLKLMPMTKQMRADSSDVPILGVQVTKFQGGGLAIGVSFTHVVADGMSIVHFMQSWAECCKGVPISLRPTHERTLLQLADMSLCKPSSQVYHPFPPCPLDDPSYKGGDVLEQRLRLHTWKVYSFTSSSIEVLKAVANVDSTAYRYSSFEVLAAHVSLCLAKLHKLQGNDKVRVVFWMNGRARLLPNIPRSYFGNCAFEVVANVMAGELLHGGLPLAARLIHEAIGKNNTESTLSLIKDTELNGCVMRELPNDCKLEVTFTLSTKIPVYKTDFGWGAPVCVRPGLVPTNDLVLMPGKPGSGIIAEMIMVGMPTDQIHHFIHILRSGIQIYPNGYLPSSSLIL